MSSLVNDFRVVYFIGIVGNLWRIIERMWLLRSLDMLPYCLAGKSSMQWISVVSGDAREYRCGIMFGKGLVTRDILRSILEQLSSGKTEG